MARAFQDARSFETAVAEMAEALRRALAHMSDDERRRLVTRLFFDSDMVFGVWPDAGADAGVGLHIIKGEDTMPPLAAFEPPREITLAAIPCAGRAQAVAARRAWGDRVRSDADDPPVAGEGTPPGRRGEGAAGGEVAAPPLGGPAAQPAGRPASAATPRQSLRRAAGGPGRGRSRADDLV